ncbi:MAG: GIY-YIG nuclease family protein [Woeseiaceae bacterium]
MSGAVYSVYMLRCSDGSLYTGIATDVSRRLIEHQTSPRGAKYLRGRGPLQLAYEQEIGDRGSATRVEYCLKLLAKADKEALVAGQISLADVTPGLSADQASGAGGG